MQAMSINSNAFDLQRTDFVSYLQPLAGKLAGANWQRRREIIGMLVQRIDIDTGVIKIIFRVTQNARDSDSDSIAITLPRRPKTV